MRASRRLPRSRSTTGVDGGGPAAFIFKTVADPFAGRINVFRVLSGTLTSDSNLVNARTHGKERVGQLLLLQGKDHEPAQDFGEGDIGAVAKLKETGTGDVLLTEDKPIELAPLDFPQPVMSFAITPKAKGDEEKMATALRRLHEEDPTLTLRRDEQTGEQLLGGLSQIHVEVAVDRLSRRFGVEVDLHQPRVPYLETIRKESRAQGRYKKQTGGRGQFGDCHVVLEPLPGHEGYEFVDKIVGGVIPQSFRPAVDKGIQEAMIHGELAGAPVTGLRVLLVDGSYHSVDSSEMAFKIAGSMAFKSAYENADPVLLEPIMSLEAAVPGRRRGRVNGDLNSRRGRLLGMEPAGAGMTTIKAEVPMADVLTYSQSLTSLTGGRGDYRSLPSLRGSALAHRAEGDGRRRRRRPRSDPSSATRTSSAPARSATGRCSWASARCASPGRGDDWVDVCALCTATADDHGWVKEGSPTTPIVPETRRRRRFGGLGSLLESRRAEPEPRGPSRCTAASPPEEQAMVEAADLFNESAYRRTIAGIAKSLGDARVSLLPLSGRQPGGRDHGRLGHLLVPVPGLAGLAAARAPSRARLRARRARPPLHALERPPRRRGPRHARTSRACSSATAVADKTGTMIYCVIPPELEAELYDRLVEHYKDNPNVEVIVDRRTGPDRRRNGYGPPEGEQRTIRDRRRARPGTFPATDRPGTG